MLPRVDVALLDRPEYAINPTFDEALQRDAVTCATCHVRDGIVYGPYGDTQAPHPTAKNQSLLKVDVCTRCPAARARIVTVAPLTSCVSKLGLP